MSKLSNAHSAYLRHSAYQKVDWYPWSDEAFDTARRKDMPVFLSTGAVWCHWCHVMARECFENEDIAAYLNNNFINIKLDRDERPDIDRRYQQAVAAMGSGGGWPLSVFMTPGKVPFFGGTYFPPEDIGERPGFKKVLSAVVDLYKSKRNEISDYTGKLLDALKPEPMVRQEIRTSQLDDAVGSILSEFDASFGGFGSAPKFPMPGAISFLINRYYLAGDEKAGAAVKKTLTAMAKGGFHDHLGGGFHRYATDRAWIIPHFEKMADDNAWLLRNYLDAFAVFGDDNFRSVAAGIINFMRSVLSDPRGGFFASQDADVSPEDEGGYFTWTDDEFRRVLDENEYRVLSACLMHEAGAMHHDTSKKVLHIEKGMDEIAGRTGMDMRDVHAFMRSGREKLLAERVRRETPFIDTTLYTSLNGMCITSFLHGYRLLGDVGLKDFALRSLEKILDVRLTGNRLYHSEGVDALLDDYVFIVEAMLSAYEVTGGRPYLDTAGHLMNMCMDKLMDIDEGGFFDTDNHTIGIQIKGIEDIPQPSANALAIRMLLKLHSLTGDGVYMQHAEKSLGAFAAKAGSLGIHCGYYFCSLDAYFNTLKLSVEASPDSEITGAALSSFSPYTDIVYEGDRNRVIPCSGRTCFEPVHDPVELKNFIIGRKHVKDN